MHLQDCLFLRFVAWCASVPFCELYNLSLFLIFLTSYIFLALFGCALCYNCVHVPRSSFIASFHSTRFSKWIGLSSASSCYSIYFFYVFMSLFYRSLSLVQTDIGISFAMRFCYLSLISSRVSGIFASSSLGRVGNSDINTATDLLE